MSAEPSPADMLREASLRVLRGNPRPDELAALVAVLSVVRARATCTEPTGSAAPRATWDRPDDTYHSPLAWVSPFPGARL